MTKSYFEIGGNVIELDTALPHLSSQYGDPSGVSQIAKQQAQPAVRNGRQSASPRAVTPYTGIGHPLVWLGTGVLLKGVEILVGSQPQDVY